MKIQRHSRLGQGIIKPHCMKCTVFEKAYMSSPFTIVADENIPYVKEAFQSLGKVTLVPGRTITPSTIKHAQALLVRSTTKVNRELLEGSHIQFVGTATAGLDHIEAEYLHASGVEFATAEGANANSVAEYVMTALLILARQNGLTLFGKTIGIIGVGNIGRLVQAKAEALGMTVVLNDPPLAETTDERIYRPLEEALECDVVTVHVPLTFEGAFKTFHLLDKATLTHLSPATIFINTSRGEVVETQPLLNQLEKGSLGATVLDVWEFEPDINWELFKLVSLGTPHIAGYSLDGKAQGTFMIYQALCKYLDLEPSWKPSHSLPSPELPHIEIETTGKFTEQILCDLTTRTYNLEADHRRMTELLQIPCETRPLEFDQLRKCYPIRREFHNTKVQLVNGGTKLQQQIAGLGFPQFAGP